VLRPKVSKILNEKFRDHSNVLFLGLTRAGSGALRCEVGLGAGFVQGTNALHTHLGQANLTA
jgi:hypothetical protein